jgi:hypothetical protein
VDSFFGALFQEPVEDECRAKHHTYVHACSSLKTTLTYCLACYLSGHLTKIPNDHNEVGNSNRLILLSIGKIMFLIQTISSLFILR